MNHQIFTCRESEVRSAAAATEANCEAGCEWWSDQNILGGC